MTSTENKTVFYPSYQTAKYYKFYGVFHFHWEYIVYGLVGYYALCFLLFIPIGILAKNHPNRYYRAGISCKCCYKSCIKEYFAAERHYKQHPTTCIYCATCCKNPFDLLFVTTSRGRHLSLDSVCKVFLIPIFYVILWVVFLLFVEIHVLINLLIHSNTDEINFEINFCPEDSEAMPVQSVTPSYNVNEENVTQQPLIDNPYQ
ncbi:hypothetical protein TVAG_087550 [Trichomonas vaginalis G3]|uniref:Uncharacterized protein n=1 Tax=Trichomonas vaginalis (strain ATCC PRA-98 / G3) TaxID=412133 RepID=A2FDT1_TRIV3|nr:hypothetical protein TVAGG3_0371270 [Trichomonas vaginalis G3]EAX96930.1 hypothetical protein TVAG_087550 [Trichomonas vaginalis G3]KAI5532623.1 hypothetical protein TVAGG3_0371270 [Trichomonas vaginalis G3]|eukprot:XP_001309860.1 hypothetical protein [Trichomonas vaginalis G3]